MAAAAAAAAGVVKNGMDEKVLAFYRQIYADAAVDRDEASALERFLKELNPPPDKLIWMRAAAFRVATEFIKNDDRDWNVRLLQTVHGIVQAMETVCLQPKSTAAAAAAAANHAWGSKSSSSSNTSASVDLDETAVRTLYQQLFQDDLAVNAEENEALQRFWTEQNPPKAEDLVQIRNLAFDIGSEHLKPSSSSSGDAGDDEGSVKETNVKIFKCINVIVHSIQTCCYVPKPFVFQEEHALSSLPAAAAAATAPAAGKSFDYASMSLPDAVQHLWDLDVNRLNPNVDYRMNVQEGKKPYWKEDMAPDPLFEYVDESSCFQSRPTYKTFVALLDNYQARTGEKEQVTDKERAEINSFLQAILQTQPMQFCHRYCRAQKPNVVPKDQNEFIQLLYKIWFDLYRRETSNDSSGFEHVFVGEVKNGQISGFHNWIRFYLEEKAGRVDYRGYIKPKNAHGDEADSYDHLLSLQFRWQGVEKFVGSSFIGVSPEFEMALYSTCFLVGEQDNPIVLQTGTPEKDVFKIVIKCYRIANDKVGTCYPELVSHFEEA